MEIVKDKESSVHGSMLGQERDTILRVKSKKFFQNFTHIYNVRENRQHYFHSESAKRPVEIALRCKGVAQFAEAYQTDKLEFESLE